MGNVCPSDQQKGSLSRKIAEEEEQKKKQKERNLGEYIKLEGEVPKVALPNPQYPNQGGADDNGNEEEDATVCIMSRKRNKKINVKDFSMIQVSALWLFGLEYIHDDDGWLVQ